MQEFPRKARGLDYDLNWSLAGDSVTARGDAFRNAPVRTLLEFTPRAEVKSITKQRALVTKTAESAAVPAAAFSTDPAAIPGTAAVSIEEFEDKLASVSGLGPAACSNSAGSGGWIITTAQHGSAGQPMRCDRSSSCVSPLPHASPLPHSPLQLRDDCMSYAPRLFVEDGAVGSSRATQLHVRLVTDSAVQALAFRSLLQRVPLYSPELFPRTLTVYSGTLASAELLAGAGKGSPFTITDVDAGSSRGTILAAGAVSVESLSAAISRAAAQLMQQGGYRHVAGGSHVANLREARADGLLHWYTARADAHSYGLAAAGEAHPDLLALPAVDVIAAAGAAGSTLVLGDRSGAVAAAAAGKASLYAAGGAIWHATEGLSSFWGGAALPAGSPAAAAAGLPRGSLLSEGKAFVPLSGPKTVGQPAAVVLVAKEAAGKKLAAAEAAPLVAQTLGLTAKQAEKVAARLASVGSITGVASAAEAVAALKL